MPSDDFMPKAGDRYQIFAGAIYDGEICALRAPECLDVLAAARMQGTLIRACALLNAADGKTLATCISRLKGES